MIQKNRDNEDVKGVVDRFVMTISQMEAILAKETDFLKVANREGFMALQDEKVSIAHNYQRDIFAVKNVANALKTKYPSLVPFLQDKQAKLSSIIAENEGALRRMERSTQRLNDRIMEVARDTAAAQNSFSYSSGGEIGKDRRASMGLSESA